MARRSSVKTAIAFTALISMTAAALASPGGAYTMAPIRIGKLEARTGEALLQSAAYIEASPREGVIRLQLERFDPAVREVEVEGLGDPVTVTDSTILVIAADAGKAPVRRTLNYTVRYARTVFPGFRPAPLRISVLP